MPAPFQLMHFAQRYQPVDAIATEVVDGELVLLQLNDGVYFGLDWLGTQIWNRLVAGCSLSQINTELERMYPTQAPETLSRDVEALVLELVDANLVRANQLAPQ